MPGPQEEAEALGESSQEKQQAHGEERSGKESSNGKAADRNSGSCLRSGCHEDLTRGKPAIHGPLAVEACAACHKKTDGEDHAFELAREEEETCSFCHGPLKALAVVHKPFEKRACTTCHDPHSGADRSFLVAEEEPGGLCVSCHEKKAFKAAHKPYASGQCKKCHLPHQSELPALVRKGEPDLCLGCHEPMAQALRAARSVHKPIRDGRCGSCHQAHGSENPWLLEVAYPAGIYEVFQEEKYELCLSACHSAEAFTDPSSTRTGFRDGQRNLHRIHVVQSQRDKDLTCWTCHDAHAARGAKLIRKEVAYGEWAMPLYFEAAARGGKCAPGCHKPLSYDRGAEPEAPQKEAEPPAPAAGPRQPPAETDEAPAETEEAPADKEGAQPGGAPDVKSQSEDVSKPG